MPGILYDRASELWKQPEVARDEVFSMTRAALTVQKRDASGKSPVARRLRSTGQVPGILYRDSGSEPFSVDRLELNALLRKGATLVDLELDGSSILTVLKETQLHPVRGDVRHVDLQEVRMDQKVKTVASVSLVGDCPGVKAGGILTQGARELSIESTPTNIPDTITIDLSGIDVGQTLILRDLTAPEGVSFLDDPGMMMVSITVPRGAKGKGKAAAAATEAASAE